MEILLKTRHIVQRYRFKNALFCRNRCVVSFGEIGEWNHQLEDESKNELLIFTDGATRKNKYIFFFFF